MSLEQLLPKDRSLLTITAVVIAVHVSVIAFTMLTSTSQKIKEKEAKRLVVQTISLSPQTAPSAASRQPLIAEALPPPPEPEINYEEIEEENHIDDTPPPQPKPAPTPKPTPKPVAEPKPKPKTVPAEPKPTPKPVPKAAEKKPAPIDPPKKETKPKPKTDPAKPATPPKKPASTPAPKKEDAKPKAPVVDQAAIDRQKKLEAKERADREKQQALLADAQERIANIGKNRDKIGSTASSKSTISGGPKSITSLEIDALWHASGPQLSDKEMSYIEEISGRMKLQLRMPQYGEVKIKLTLNRTGKVAKVFVLSAESNENKKYIEKTVPGLNFPPFGSQLGNVDEYTFTITLRNE
jgi:colicin import membrane protein